MNTSIASTLRIAAVVASIAFSTSGLSAKGDAPIDHASQTMARHGTINLKAVGPYVEIGTYRIWVDAKLGRPSARLPDGTWLYHGYEVKDTDASGTLVVCFREGRVSNLSLVTRAFETAMLNPKASPEGILIARSR